jgi:N-acetylglucosamine-6-phosphate deacetylase
VTTNPAAMIGITDAGRIAAGMPANLVVLDTAGRLVAAAVQSSEFIVRN